MNIVKKAVTTSVIVLGFLTILFGSRCTAAGREKTVAGENGFAVLELFTSEGCSSCPPADALAARLQNESAGKPVYILAYHVDYWNRQGWADAFSSPVYTERQQRYSRQLPAQVYTPQLVINGRSEYIGSDDPAVRAGLERSLHKASGTTLRIQARQQAGKAVLEYRITGNAGNDQLLVALVQKQAASKVSAGENGGRTLYHVQIVKALHTFALKNDGTGRRLIDVPEDFNSRDWELIGMLQDPDTGAIDAASRAALTVAASPMP